MQGEKWVTHIVQHRGVDLQRSPVVSQWLKEPITGAGHGWLFGAQVLCPRLHQEGMDHAIYVATQLDDWFVEYLLQRWVGLSPALGQCHDYCDEVGSMNTTLADLH